MSKCQFILSMVLAIYVGFSGLNHMWYVHNDLMRTDLDTARN